TMARSWSAAPTRSWSPSTGSTGNWSRVPDAIETAMAERGERLAVGANHPVVLDADHAVYVGDGALDLFVQPVRGDEAGKRRLVGTAGTSALVVGPSLDQRPGWRVLAVGRPGTQLVRLDVATL